MCTTKWHFITYNTHLFPDPLAKFNPNAGPLFIDGARATSIRQYLEVIQPYSKSGYIQVAALQEVWDSGAVSDITEGVGVSHHGSYDNWYNLVPRHYYISPGDMARYLKYLLPNANIVPAEYPFLNPPGLMLLADPICDFKTKNAFNYMTSCILNTDGWALQDIPVAKGFFETKLDYPCPDIKDKRHAILLFTTHMPTNYGTYTTSLRCCFDTLQSEIKSFQSGAHQGFPTFVIGDLNIDSYDQNLLSDPQVTEYTDAVTDRLLSGTGLIDAAAEASSTPATTVVPATNNLWQHFNSSEDPNTTPAQRIDYFFYANSNDGTSMTVSVDSIGPIPPSEPLPLNAQSILVAQDASGTWFNDSDHYPLEAYVTITANDN